jgi:hypothetical protein
LTIAVNKAVCVVVCCRCCCFSCFIFSYIVAAAALANFVAATALTNFVSVVDGGGFAAKPAIIFAVGVASNII